MPWLRRLARGRRPKYRVFVKRNHYTIRGLYVGLSETWVYDSGHNTFEEALARVEKHKTNRFIGMTHICMRGELQPNG